MALGIFFVWLLGWVTAGAMRLQCVSYNPMNVNFDRLDMILHELHGFNVIFLPGTSKSKFSDDKIRPYPLGGFTVFSFDYISNKKFPGINKSCGCMIAIRTSCFPHYHKIYEPPDDIAGRAGAIRVTRPDMDSLFLVFDFAPDMSNKEHKQVSRKVAKWVRSLVLKMPKRCTVFFGCDVSGKIGTETNGLDFYPNVGRSSPDKENFNGVLFRELLVDTNLAAANTHFDTGSTFYSNRGNGSRIDYIGTCVSMVTTRKVSKVMLLNKSGDRLQKARVCGRNDHRPLALYCNVALEFRPPTSPQTTLCPDLLMLAIQNKFRNADFVSHIDEWASRLLQDPSWEQF